MNYDNLETGDLLLFASNFNSGFLSYFTNIIKYGSHSNYTHIAMVLKDPDFINPPLKGLYVWESGFEGVPDPQDNKIKLGVQITPLDEILKSYENNGTVILRKINCSKKTLNKNIFNKEILKKIHSVVYDRPYDIMPMDWIRALLRIDNKPQKTDRFWCSALIGYIYTKCGILNENTDWSILSPNDFSLETNNLNYLGENKLSNSVIKIQ